MIKPHGGKLVTKILSKAEAKKVLARSYRRIAVNRDFILDLEKIAIGAYSPLTGFMKREDVASVVHRMRLSSGEPWTIPIVLMLPKNLANTLKDNEKIILCEENGKEVGLMRVEDVFSFDKKIWAEKVFGINSHAHPGVKRLFEGHSELVGGEIWLIEKYLFEFEKFNLTPSQTRAIIKRRGWQTVAGFQTRNVPHRAHEYLQKIALTVTDGILIHPIIGWKKDGDFKPEIVIKAYKVLIDRYFPKNSVIFAGLATAMRYAGPREAVFHAIIRKNYGCTHFIVGRDHAGVGEFYGKYDAHEIFQQFPDLGIVPLLLREPYYCKKCKEIVSDRVCPHGERWHQYISGTMIRKKLCSAKTIAQQFMRKEVFEVIKKIKNSTFI
jgi:sulfate adenylyltransferase